MKNKILTIFGICSWILSVIASAENTSGKSAVPPTLLLISETLFIVFIIIAIIYLWKHSKGSSILLLASSVIYIGGAIMQIVNSPSDGSSLILIMNIIKVIYAFILFWTVSLLWGIKKSKATIDILKSKATTTIDKTKYEHELARYLYGLSIATTIIFIIGKIIGYFDFLSWWWVTSPFITCLIGSVVNYLNWVPKYRILFYTIYLVYATSRVAILRLILWIPIFSALITGYRIIRKYGLDRGYILIAIVATIATYLFTIKLSGRSPGMPD